MHFFITMSQAWLFVVLGLAIFLSARAIHKGWHPSTLIATVIPLGLTGLAASLAAGIPTFWVGFREMAERGEGGRTLVARICLPMRSAADHAFTVNLVALTIVGFAAAACWYRSGRRIDSPIGSQQALARSWSALAGVALVAFGAAILALYAGRLTWLIMIMVDPDRKAEAFHASEGMGVGDVSQWLTEISQGVIGGGILLFGLALGAGIYAYFAKSSTRPTPLAAWTSFLVLALVVGWLAWSKVEVRRELRYLNSARAETLNR